MFYYDNLLWHDKSMEILAYVLISIITFFGLTALPTRWIVGAFGVAGGNASVINFFPIFGAIITWTFIDAFYLNILNNPIPIVLFLICWFVKLLDDFVIKKADWQTQVNMAEAWVLFVWAIIAMFGDYRAWL